MNENESKALLLYLINKLKDSGNWCGETHIQKSVFFLQNLAKIPTGHIFILYKHGPFSFDLRDDLTSMRADGLLSLEPKQPYGSSFKFGKLAEVWLEKFSEGLDKYYKEVDNIVDILAEKKVKELERLATALYLKQRYQSMSKEEMINKLITLKPHVNKNEAVEAFDILKKLH